MITIAARDFHGPYQTSNDLRNAPGIYVILDYRVNESSPYVVDVGESDFIQTRIEGHDRKSCWNEHSQGSIFCAVLYTVGWTEEQRQEVESIIRQQYNPPCGDR